MNILDLLQEDKIIYKKVSANKEEYTSPCPKCDGKDRFCISPNKGGLWYCRRCNKGGGIVQYLTEFRKMSYQDACLFLGQNPTFSGITSRLKRISHPSSNIWKPTTHSSPPVQWQKEADDFIKRAENNLWSETCVDIRSWLFTDRGLNEETIKSARLGYNPSNFYCQRERWGLPPRIDENGKSKDLWLSVGLVIPYIHNQQIQRIRIRLQNPIGDLRYYILSGSIAAIPMMLNPKEYMVVVESELDGILINQVAGDIVGVIALGAVGIRPDKEAFEILRQAKLILVSLDSDEAGAKESFNWWGKYFSNSRRWCPINGKDPTEAYQKGLNLRSWILAGLSNFVKPQEKETITINTPNPSFSVNYILIEDKESLNDAISQIETSPIIALDTETTGLDPIKDKIRLIQFAVPDHPVMIIDTWKFSNEDLSPLQTLLSGPSEKIFQNAKFDMKFLYQTSFKIKGRLFDTMLAAQLLTSGIKYKGFGLGDLARDYLDEELPKEYQKSDWTGEISHDQLVYGVL